MKIKLLSNINLFMLEKKLNKSVQVYTPPGYGGWIQELLAGEETADAVFCIIDGQELFKGMVSSADIQEAYDYINRMKAFVEKAVATHPESTFFISDIDLCLEGISPLSRESEIPLLEYSWLTSINDICKNNKNAFVFPLKRLITELGRDSAYSPKMWYLASAKFSTAMEEVLKRNILKMVKALKKERCKCLVLDLDNTLWGGVIGEDGINGIALSDNKEGARYKDFQRKIKAIKDMGIILAIVSKNNEADAMEVFDCHTDMVLKWNDFAAKRINWETKAENIKSLADELNIGLDSMVFIDDNPVERESVKLALPEVNVPEFPVETEKLAKWADKLYEEFFFTLKVSEEDLSKTEQYIHRKKVMEAQESFNSLDDFIKSLEMTIDLHEVGENEIERAHQLVNKTNQFNTTTIRYSENELKDIMRDGDSDLFIAGITDKFGDNGKAVLLVVRKKEAVADIEEFIMSCRVMGRKIEDTILEILKDKYRLQGIKTLTAKYVPTAKNTPVKNLYDRLGFELIEEKGDDRLYSLKL